MAPTRMKLRVRRRDNMAAAGGGGRARDEEAAPGQRRESSRKKSKAPAPAAFPEAAAAEEASPDSKCPICLDRFDNVAFLDRCLHRFCFPCIQEWSHSKAECPLCKQPFASILHSVRAEDDFKEYTLRPPPAGGGVAATVAMVAAMATVARSSHQMRLTLRRHRTTDGGETTAAVRRRGRERGGSRAEDGGAGVWEWYLDSPPLNRRPAAIVDELAVQPEMSSEERGVIFEGLAGLEGAETTVVPNDRASRRLMTRLAARRRLQREGGMPRRLREREALALRRGLYRCGVRVHGIAGASGDSGQEQRDVSADGFRRSPTLLNRLRPWLRRELTVLYGAHGSLVEIVQRIITVRLARHGLEDPLAIEEELRPFLLARTEHFLHELANFARSPLSMDSYDLQAVYEPPAPTGQLDWISSSSDSSSVIAISEDDDELVGGAEDTRLTEEGGANEDGCLSMSGWDDETPGPSYSSANADQPCSVTSPTISPAPAGAGEKGGGEEECLIVGYKKPIAERTPELVQLSSDSEAERQEAEPQAPEAQPRPPEALPLSFLSTIPPSTSAAFREEKEAGPRARSWSESTKNSACTISPAASSGGGGKRRRETTSWREKRRKRRKKRKKGTIYNPNRSIYPAMMQRHPCSSGESGSPPSPVPSSSWEISSLSSSGSSSSSPLSSPSQPQIPPLTAVAHGDGCHGEKPGGKRKYKSRHLDNEVKDPTWKPRRRHRERDGGNRKRTREERSPSVEIIYEGTVAPSCTNVTSNKRHCRRRHRTQQDSSPVVITLDSDTSVGGSPLHFSSPPPLPLVPLADVGGTLGAQIGQLPVDFLDRGSYGSAAEPSCDRGVTGPIPSDRSDVENMEVSAGEDLDARFFGMHRPIRAAGDRRARPGSVEDCTKPEVADILNVKAKAQLTFDPSCSPESRARRYRSPCDVSPDVFPLNRPTSQSALSLNTQLDCQREDWDQVEDRVRTSLLDVPPLFRHAGPVQFYNRNTSPPPLKHKDTGSPPRPALHPEGLHLVPIKPHNVGLTTPSFKAAQLDPSQTLKPEASVGSLNHTPTIVPSPANTPLDHPESLGVTDRPPSLHNSLTPPAEVNHTISPHPPLVPPAHLNPPLQSPPDSNPRPCHSKLSLDFPPNGRSLEGMDGQSGTTVQNTNTQAAT